MRAALEGWAAPDADQDRLRRAFLARLDEGPEALRREGRPSHLTASAVGTFARTEYEGSGVVEDGLVGTLRVDNRLNRTFGVRARFTHERLDSTLLRRDYTANVVLVGVRLQR